MLQDGDSTMMMNVTGELDGVVVATDVNSCFTAYTSDGLTLGWINRDPAGRVAMFGPNAVYMENVQPGLLYKNPKTSRRWLAFSSTEDMRIIDIDGIWGDQIARQRGSIELPSSLPAGAAGWPLPGAGEQLGGDRRRPLPGGRWLRRRMGSVAACHRHPRRPSDNSGGPPAPRRRPPLRDGRGARRQPLSGLRRREHAGLRRLPGAGTAPRYCPAGPHGNRRGRTRIVLSAQRRDDGTLVGVALACRPGSKPWTPTADMRQLNKRGEPDGPLPLPKAIDWRRELKPIPGATVAVRQRFDRKGWRLEAEVPFGLLPELVTLANVLVKRQDRVSESRECLDITGPFRFNAAVWLPSDEGVRRVAWMADGFTGSDPTTMAPASWGLANDAVNLSWQEVDEASSYRIYRAAKPDPLMAALVKTVEGETTAVDLPGLGAAWYWLAPVGTAGEGQWLGPVPVRETIVTFPACAYLPPLDPAGIKKATLEVFPGHARLLNMTGFTKLEVKSPQGVAIQVMKRGNGLWMLAVTPSGPVPDNAAIRLIDVGGKTAPLALHIAAAPVPPHCAAADLRCPHQRHR